MAIQYGVLRGKPDRYQREDGADTPHLQIRVLDDTGQPWRIAVNVESGDGSEVVYWIVDPLASHPVLDGLTSLASGFTKQAPTSTTTLDYLKAPLFDLAKGRVLPPSGSASSDDLQDLLSLYLDQCTAAGGEVFAFGAKFTSNQHIPIDTEFGNTDGLHGVHDIHMNQGNPTSGAGASFARDNGAHHDGGLVLSYGGRYVGLFLAFQTQRVPTDAKGDPTANAKSLSQVIGGASPQPPTPNTPTPGGDVYLAQALVNPVGPDDGLEVVVLANLATKPAALTGWTLTDRNERTTSLDVTVEAGATAAVTLDGNGVQLGNGGGSLTLTDASGEQVDSVTWTAADASVEGRYVRFTH